MIDERPSGSDDPRGPNKPVTVVNGTRITVAFPFSQIKLQEPAEETKELVALVADLAETVAALVPGNETEALRQRAVALAARVGAGPAPA